MFTDQRERPLLNPKRGTFFDTDLRPLTVATERGEHRRVEVNTERVIPPMAGCDHASVQI